MSRRQRVNKDSSNTKKEIAVIAASSLIPVAGAVIAPILVAKKVLPKVSESISKRKSGS
ncbi:MAG: hypothetical protein J6Y71_09700 [Ruminococcus sp.]|nr:hypothetical protein [Ruminococcus sp.]